MTLDKILEELFNQGWLTDDTCMNKKFWQKEAVAQAKKEILGCVPEGKDKASDWFSGFNACRNQILKNLNGEK
jgi:hypothetical protein